MGQSLTQLPRTAEFKILGHTITIVEHKVKNYFGLSSTILDIINDQKTNRRILSEFEKHGVSFEAAIECCATELEYNVNKLARVIIWNYERRKFTDWISTEKNTKEITVFTASLKGRRIAEELTAKIRNCDNWEELHDELHMNSEFQTEMKKRIREEMRQQ